jgi:ribosomal protein S7
VRPRNQEISEKYKALRLLHDSLYQSHVIQTFFNKFTRKGKKALARRQLFAALTSFRLAFRRPSMYFVLTRLFRRLHVQFILRQRRQARQLLSVPFPVRRNKREVLSLQTVYRAISGRHERSLAERIQYELSALTFDPKQAPTARARSAQYRQIYEDRVNVDRRWK